MMNLRWNTLYILREGTIQYIMTNSEQFTRLFQGFPGLILPGSTLCFNMRKWSSFRNMYVLCVSKKTHLKEMCDFLTLKMLPLALALIKTKIPIFLTHWSENADFTWEFEFLMPGENFPLKKVNFWPMGQKDFFLSMPEPMVTFLGLKNHTSS